MGARTPGGPRPPMGDGRPPRPPKNGGKPRPPKEVIIPITPPKEGGKPGIRPPKPPKGDKSPEIFNKLLEGIKKAGGFPGGPRKGKPFGGRGGKPIVSRPAPGSNIPLDPIDRPLDPSGDPFPPKPKIIMGPDDRPVEVWPWGREDDPDYDRKKKEYFEKKMGPMPKPEPFGTGPKGDPRSFPVDPRTLPTYRDDPFPKGIRREAVTFRGMSPSTESRRPTKESPKVGMTKAGPVDAKAKNKFEEMLAYMKSFQK